MSAAEMKQANCPASEKANPTHIDPQSTEEHGRTYHAFKQGRYVLPNDSAEQQRLNSQHRLLKLLLDDSLSVAPVEEVTDVLDIGTGTGQWALEFANIHPKSRVIGTDLSMIQPENMQSNCRFVRADAEDEEWDFGTSFDYIHLRMMISCFNNPQKIIRNIFNNLNPGGWVEFQDLDVQARSDDGSTRGTSVERLGKGLEDGLAALNRDPKIASKYQSMLREAGFVDVVEKQIAVPCGMWPEKDREKQIGQVFLETYTEERLQGMSMKMLLAAGLSNDEITELLAATVRDYNNTDIHTYVTLYVTYGRKPN